MLKVKNPGLFPYNVTKVNIGKVRSDGYRNDLLVKHLREFPQPPNLDQNEGVKAMQNEMNARIFRVSAIAMSIRLTKLGLLSE